LFRLLRKGGREQNGAVRSGAILVLVRAVTSTATVAVRSVFVPSWRVCSSVASALFLLLAFIIVFPVSGPLSAIVPCASAASSPIPIPAALFKSALLKPLCLALIAKFAGLVAFVRIVAQNSSSRLGIRLFPLFQRLVDALGAVVRFLDDAVCGLVSLHNAHTGLNFDRTASRTRLTHRRIVPLRMGSVRAGANIFHSSFELVDFDFLVVPRVCDERHSQILSLKKV